MCIWGPTLWSCMQSHVPSPGIDLNIPCPSKTLLESWCYYEKMAILSCWNMIETLNKVETSFQGTQELSASKDLLIHTLPTCIKVGIDEMSF